MSNQDSERSHESLTKLFAALGAAEPSRWASSQTDEGIPQLARFLFLRQAWSRIVPEGDDAWIAEQRKIAPTAPGGTSSLALARLLALGAQPEDLTAVVRVMQWQLLSSFCYLLDDPGDLESEVGDIAWRLFQVDENDTPLAAMTGLHESVLETAPGGNEMRGQ